MKERCKREKTKRFFIRLVFREKKTQRAVAKGKLKPLEREEVFRSISTPPPPFAPPFIFRCGYLNTAKIMYHFSVIRGADRSNLQHYAEVL